MKWLSPKEYEVGNDPAPAGSEVEGVLCEHVLTWHPLNGDPVELPLFEHVTFDGSQVGEFRLSTREVRGG